MFRRMTSGDVTPPEDVNATLNRWIGERWDASGIQEFLGDDSVYMESAQMLVRQRDYAWTHQDLRKAATSERWFYHDDLITPMQEGIAISLKPPNYPRYWYLDKGGSCYSSWLLQENNGSPGFSSGQGHPEKMLWVDVTIHRIALELRGSAALYKELNIPPDEPYLLSIKHGGLKGRTSYAHNFDYIGYIAYSFSSRTSQEDNHVWQGEVTQDLVSSQLVELTQRIASELFALFSFTEVPMDVVRHVLARSRNDRGEPLLSQGS